MGGCGGVDGSHGVHVDMLGHMGHGAHVDMLGHMPKSHVAVDPMLDFLC